MESTKIDKIDKTLPDELTDCVQLEVKLHWM